MWLQSADPVAATMRRFCWVLLASWCTHELNFALCRVSDPCCLACDFEAQSESQPCLFSSPCCLGRDQGPWRDYFLSWPKTNFWKLYLAPQLCRSPGESWPRLIILHYLIDTVFTVILKLTSLIWVPQADKLSALQGVQNARQVQQC